MRVKIKPIVPRKVIASPAEVEAAIEAALDRNAADCLADFQKTTRTWKTKVNFTVHKTKYGRSIGTASKIYKFVDQGTAPHIIKPKRPGYPLRFNVGGFKAKTKPRIVTSYNGAAATTPTAAMLVHHPGTEARGFAAVIQTRAKSRVSSYFKQELKKAFGK